MKLPHHLDCDEQHAHTPPQCCAAACWCNSLTPEYVMYRAMMVAISNGTRRHSITSYIRRRVGFVTPSEWQDQNLKPQLRADITEALRHP